MSLTTGAAKLNHAIRQLREQWHDVRTVWTDVVAQEFEENHLQPIEMLVRSTLTAIDRLDHVLEQARNACE